MSVAHIKSTRQVTRRVLVTKRDWLAYPNGYELVEVIRQRLIAAGFDLTRRIPGVAQSDYDRGGYLFEETVEVMAGE